MKKYLIILILIVNIKIIKIYFPNGIKQYLKDNVRAI